MQAEVALDKVGSMASSKNVLVELKNRLGPPIAIDSDPPANLGVDHQAGARRVFAKGSKRKQRMKALARRSNIVARKRAMLRKGRARFNTIAKMGMEPAFGYGCRVWGLSNVEALNARRKLLRHAPPSMEKALHWEAMMKRLRDALNESAR